MVPVKLLEFGCVEAHVCVCASGLASCFPGKSVRDSGSPTWVGGQDTDGEGRVMFGALFLTTHSNTSKTPLIVAFPAFISITWCKYLFSSANTTFDSFAKANNPFKII